MHVNAGTIGLSLLLSATILAGEPPKPATPMDLMAVPADGVAYYSAKVKARAAHAEQKWAEAEPLLEKLAAEYPRDPENWMMLGRTKFRLKKMDEAVAAWSKAGPLIGWNASFGNGYRIAMAHAAAGNKRAALDMLRVMTFERHGISRVDLFDWEEFAALKDDPEFLEIIGRPETKGWSRDDGWRKDIDYLRAEVKRVNPEYRDAPFPAEFEKRYQALKTRVPDLSDEEIFVGMGHMLSSLRQGHTVLFSFKNNRYLPLRFYAFPEGIFVIDASKDHADLIGARVVKLGTLTAEEALRRMSETMSVDGDMEYLWATPRLAETAFLKGLGATDSIESIPVTIQQGSGPARTITMDTVTTRPEDRPDKLLAPRGVTPPLFLRDVAQMHWETALPKHDALYVQVNNMMDEETESLRDFGKRLWTVLQTSRAKNLILDLRHNNGGNTHNYDQLLRTVIAFSRVPGQQVYALIGRRSYSATANFVTDLERLADPVFVGEATSECCDFYGDPAPVVLPYSQTMGELTALKWQLSSPSDRRREMSPEVPIQLTAKAYFAGEDPALEAVYRIIKAAAKQDPDPKR